MQRSMNILYLDSQQLVVARLAFTQYDWHPLYPVPRMKLKPSAFQTHDRYFGSAVAISRLIRVHNLSTSTASPTDLQVNSLGRRERHGGTIRVRLE